MSKKHLSQRVDAPPGRAHYKGTMSDYQTSGITHRGRRYQLVEVDSLNQYQNFLYHRALFGLSVYSQEEIKAMHKEKRKRIIKVHKRTQRLLNIWKQEEVIRLSNAIFARMFPNSPVTQELLGNSNVEPEVKCPLSFRELNISKSAIIERLLVERILPNNFYSLKSEQV